MKASNAPDLEEAFINCAKKWVLEPAGEEAPQQSLVRIAREVHMQAWNALCALGAQYYGLNGTVSMRFVAGTDESDTVTVAFRSIDQNISSVKYAELSKKAGQLFDDLNAFTDDRHVKIMASAGQDAVNFALMEYEINDLLAVTRELIDGFHPQDKLARSHLNAITHLEERLALPAHRLC